MDADDRQVGRVLSRREALALFGAVMLAGCAPGRSEPEATAGAPAGATPAQPPSAVPATSAASAAATAPAEARLPSCVVRPEMTEGPFFVDGVLERSDIRTDPASGEARPGAPLALTFLVSEVGAEGCRPLPGAMVDVWHCDAGGAYSAGAEQFLRGYQLTDANGQAAFTTIYPGWYQGRAVHIHFKIRTEATGGAPAQEFTSQLFFDDAFSNQVYAQPPYAARASGGTPNSADGIYQSSGDQMTLDVAAAPEGYATTFDIGMQMS